MSRQTQIEQPQTWILRVFDLSGTQRMCGRVIKDVRRKSAARRECAAASSRMCAARVRHAENVRDANCVEDGVYAQTSVVMCCCAFGHTVLVVKEHEADSKCTDEEAAEGDTTHRRSLSVVYRTGHALATAYLQIDPSAKGEHEAQ